MIKIYSAKITDFTQADYANMYSLLDCAIKAKIDSKKRECDKRHSLAGYILLYRGVYEIYKKTEFDITFNKHGKPLCDFCFFSISHSFGHIACAVSDEPIGVDIQKIIDIKPREKYKFFNKNENHYVNQDDDLVSRRYIEIFSKKEAAIKMLGSSLSCAAEIDTFSDEFNFEVQESEKFMLTVCKKN